MSGLALSTCGPAPFWRASDASFDGPSLPVESFDLPLRTCLDSFVVDPIRTRRLLDLEISYIPHPSFDDPAAEESILAPMPTPDPASSPAPRRCKVPVGISPYLAGLYTEDPLLTREQEAHLFRKMNYLKFRASRLRAQLDPEHARTADLDQIEGDLDGAMAIRHQLVCANLRLVVSIAKRKLGPQDDLFERISDGNLVLFRAVELFDASRGNKFSTYATWAIRNQLVRAVQTQHQRQVHFHLNQDEALAGATDPHTQAPESADLDEQRQAAVAKLLARLGDRERRILIGRYGLGGSDEQTLTELGQELGITRERVRQIEARAHDKLRGLARSQEIDLLIA